RPSWTGILAMGVAANGCKFSCLVDGLEGAPWIVLSHSLATDLTMWDELADVLKGHYRVLRYDARGHGGSAATDAEYSLDLLVADVIGILDELAIDKAHFAGLSMGGMTALGLALAHPDRVTSIVVCDARASAPPEYRDAWAQRSELVRRQGIEAI